MWAIGLLGVVLAFGGVGFGLLLWPSAMLRYFQNPWQPDTPGNRVKVRPIGLVFCLFITTMLTGSEPGTLLEGFHRNVLVALGSSFFLIPVLLWFVWKFSPLKQVERRWLTGERLEDRRWELWMSVTFSGLLFVTVGLAFLFAYEGHYPHW